MEGAKAALSAGLQRRRELAATRETLELLIDTSHVVSKVERLLGELADPAVAAGSAAERARLMERTASEMNRLHFNASKGSDLALVQALAPRIGAAQRALVEQLRVQLAAGLEQNSKGVIAPCFSAFASVGDVGAAQEVVRRTVIRPVVARVLAALPASAPPNDLRPPLQALSQALPAECASVISLFKSDPGLRGLSFVPEALLSESDAALAEARPQAFSPGVPAAFLANYVAAEQFLALLEGECSTPEALAAFRASAPFSAFLKRWNLSAYFSLRYQEIAAGVEAALAESDKALAHGGGAHAQQHGLSLAVSCAVVDALERCWAKEVFLPQLTDKFFKLALQARRGIYLSCVLCLECGGAVVLPARVCLQARLLTRNGACAGAGALQHVAPRRDARAVPRRRRVRRRGVRRPARGGRRRRVGRHCRGGRPGHGVAGHGEARGGGAGAVHADGPGARRARRGGGAGGGGGGDAGGRRAAAGGGGAARAAARQRHLGLVRGGAEAAPGDHGHVPHDQQAPPHVRESPQQHGW